MKKNRNILIVVIVLAILAVILLLTNSKTTFRRALSDFAINDTSNVTMIFMSDKNNNTLRISRKLPGHNWMINDKYPGQKFNIEMLLETMLNLQVKTPVPKAAHDNIIRELAVNSVKVEIYQWVCRINFIGIKLFPHEKLTKVYYVGGATQNNLGSYMLMENSSEPFVTYLPGLRGFVSPRYSPIEKYWRDYTIFKKNIPEISSIRLEYPTDQGQSFIVYNDKGRNFRLVGLAGNQDIAIFDTLKVMNFIAAFRNLNFEAILNNIDKHRKDSILNSQPFSIITVTDTTGKSHSIKTFHKQAAYEQTDYKGKPLIYDMDRCYALVNDGQDFVLIQYYVFDRVLRPKKFFLPGYKEESPY